MPIITFDFFQGICYNISVPNTNLFGYKKKNEKMEVKLIEEDNKSYFVHYFYLDTNGLDCIGRVLSHGSEGGYDVADS